MTLRKTSHQLTLKDRTPYYEFSRGIFKKNVECFQDEFGLRYPNFALSYSVKTNNHTSIIECAEDLGLLIEIVSPDEYTKVKNITTPDRIIYNGVLPHNKSKFEVAQKGGIVNVENLGELKELASFAKKKRQAIKVGIRLNLMLSNNYLSRFGIELTEENLNEVKKIERKSRIKIAGLHIHLSNGRELKYWKERATLMAEFAKKLNVEYIDLGGNMYGAMEECLKAQFNDVPSVKDYAETISTIMEDNFPNNDVKLILECGTPLVSNAVSIFGKVVALNEINKTGIATVDFNIYDVGFLALTKNLPYHIHENSTKKKKEVSRVYGCTCTEGDLLLVNTSHKLGIGDVIEIKNIGAYSYSQSNDFITAKPKLIIS